MVTPRERNGAAREAGVGERFYFIDFLIVSLFASFKCWFFVAKINRNLKIAIT